MTTAPMRRLSDKVLAAFHQACDQGDPEVAELLLRSLEMILTRQSGTAQPDDQRRELSAIVEAYSRLMQLKRPAN